VKAPTDWAKLGTYIPDRAAPKRTARGGMEPETGSGCQALL